MTTTSLRAASLPARLAVFAGDIKIHHTVFAMPWALLAAALAGHTYRGSLTAGKIGLIVLCMVTARTVAMSSNRLLDIDLDARNPRTSGRPLPSGRLSPRFVAAMLILCCIGFIATTAAFQFFYRNPWPLVLATPVLAFLSAYPLLKRFSRLCHYYLGAALALSPVCAWVAIAARLDWPPILMFLAVLSWTAGFDILYACQDYDADVACGAFSIPAKLGIAPALWISRGTHLVSAAAIVLLGVFVPDFRWFFAFAAAAAVLLLIVEQAMVKPTNLSRINVAFFTVNGIISLVLGTAGILDLCLR